MEIKFVAFDSLGVKSSCTQVRTKDVTITIDPGIADEVDSFPLPRGQRCDLAGKYDEKIRQACAQSDIVIITHYHYDHFIDEEDKRLYGGKILLLKHPTEKINHSQAGRAASFLPKAKKIANEIHFADGKEFRFGGTIVRFSKPQWHGHQGTRLGYVLMASVIEGKEKLLYTSDLNGVYLREQADFIIKEKPSYLILDGFPSYLLGYVASFKNFKKAIENTVRIIEHTKCKWYVIDHHLLRDYRYRELYWEVYKKAKKLGKRVCTAAEMAGKKPAVLQGYEKNGPTRWREWEDFSFQKMDKLIAGAKEKAGRKNA